MPEPPDRHPAETNGAQPPRRGPDGAETGGPGEEDHSWQGPPEDKESLWWLVVSPTIWALHFLACYITVAIWCARLVGRDATLDPARIAAAAYTGVALVGIALTGAHGWRRHQHGSATAPHDFDTPGDRHRFLGFATVLLSGLSAVAVLYVAVAIAWIESCR